MSVPALIANVPFQSTLSVRRATRAVPGRVLGATFQSTLSVRRATNSRTIHPAHRTISIHALREESDLTGGDVQKAFPISIHALREESDSSPTCTSRSPAYFNPRSP